MSKKLLFKFAVLVTAMMCALGAAAAEAYACYTSSNTTLTFYYDNQRSYRPGTTYDLNTGSNDPGWYTDGTSSNVTKVVFNSSFADARPTTTYSWFYYMKNLQYITGLSDLNTSEVTNMGYMFADCKKLTSLYLSSFNTTNVTDMSFMFSGCTSLTYLDLSSFNTSKVTTMEYMFEGCSGLTSLDLRSFNTSKVTSMYYMFFDCSNLRTVYVGNGWTTTAVRSSSYMFYNCTSLVGGKGTTWSSSNPMDKTYAHIDGGTSNPGYFTGDEAYACYTSSNTTLTFYYDNLRSSRSGKTYDLNTGSSYPRWYSDGTNANVTNVVFDRSFADARPTTTYDWFYGMGNLQTIMGMSYLNTSEVTNMGYMFYSCNQLTRLDLTYFDTSKVTDMRSMFSYCIGLTSLDLSSFNTSQVTYMWYMFTSCQSLTSLDLSSFNTSQVTQMTGMFNSCNNLRTIYVGNGWSTAAVTNSTDMFKNCTSLVGGRGTTYNSSNPMDKTYAHIDGGTSNPGYFTAEGTEAYACYTESNTTLTFYYDKYRSSRPGTTTYDLNRGSNDPGWRNDSTNANVTKVVFDPSFAGARPTTTYSWFYHMDNLQTITGISYLNTSEVTNMGWMFGYCTNLTTLDLSSFNTFKVTDMFAMFFDCSNLRTIYVGNGWSTAAVTNSTWMFRDCTSLVGGQGTTYNASNPWDKTYAHIDGGPSNPGYFTDKNASLRGDVNDDGSVNISDVTTLIDYLLSGNASGVNLTAADCNQDNSVNISDVTTLIDYLLSGTW